VQLSLSDGMTYSIVACAAIGTDHAENNILLLLFTGRCLVTAGCCDSTVVASSKYAAVRFNTQNSVSIYTICNHTNFMCLVKGMTETLSANESNKFRQEWSCVALRETLQNCIYFTCTYDPSLPCRFVLYSAMYLFNFICFIKWRFFLQERKVFTHLPWRFKQQIPPKLRNISTRMLPSSGYKIFTFTLKMKELLVLF
jgi:hypothetical protein